MRFIINLLLHGLLVLLISYLLPGVSIESYLDAVLAALILALVNAFIKPFLIFLTLPVTIVTFGLFLIVINGIIVLVADLILPGFYVENLLWAILFSIILAFFNILFDNINIRSSSI